MAKENVARFFAKLSSDKVFAEKLSAADAAYAKTHDAKNVDENARKAAAEAILLPIAKEAGLPFTVEELASYEKEKMEEISGEVSDDEMANAAGGAEPAAGLGMTLCKFIGVGFGVLGCSAKGDSGLCAIVGGGGAGFCMGEGVSA